jgi:hypothetical protein
MGVRSPHVLPPFSSQFQQEHSPETAKSSLGVCISESFMFLLQSRRVFLWILIVLVLMEEGLF